MLEKLYPALLLYLQAGDSHRFCTLLGGGELQEWKSCTFLSDGIRFPISGAAGLGDWKIIPHFPS